MNIIVNEQYNIGHICTRQQCTLGLGEKVAFRWVSAHHERTTYTFNDLDRESNRFANALQALGFAAGDILFTFLPKTPEQFFSFLGALKLQVICGTLFSNFGDDALLDRLGDAKAKGIVTKKSLLKKIARVRDHLPSLKYIIVTDIEEHQSESILSYTALMRQASSDFTASLTAPDTPSVLHYTSGSTGKPKGVLHVHRSILHQSRTAHEVLNLTESDIFWCTADQGWVTGTSYGIIGPWSLGVTQIHYGGGYDARLWFDLLQNEAVTICLKTGWPSMFVTYLNNKSAYNSKFKNNWYYTGDTAVRDDDGYYWFKGRSDDVSNRASSIATPQEIIIVDSVPKNKSGKIMRRVLKARYLGQDAGDISTLED